MKECEAFQCLYLVDRKCEKYGPYTDCTIRKCFNSCRVCEHDCKNQKNRINRTLQKRLEERAVQERLKKV